MRTFVSDELEFTETDAIVAANWRLEWFGICADVGVEGRPKEVRLQGDNIGIFWLLLMPIL